MSAGSRAAAVVRAEVRAMTAYHVPPAGGLVKLDAMENPYGWPAEMREAWLRELAAVEVNRYPDAAAQRLCARLRDAFAVPDGCDMMLGNGSDEIIQIIALALAAEGAVVVAPEPGFVMYGHLARATGMRYRGVALDPADFSLPRQALLEAIECHRPALLFIAYPNNPTGNLFDQATLRLAVERAPGLVVIDEAYEPFAGTTLLSWASEYPNVVVMRTLSKLGLAGLRLGFVVGDAGGIGEFEKLRLPYNINVLTQASARFALEHLGVLSEQTARIRADREHLYQRLAAMPELQVWPSAANFLLLRTLARPADAVFSVLLEAGVLVKNLHGSAPALADCLRVSVGREDENERFLAALERAW